MGVSKVHSIDGVISGEERFRMRNFYGQRPASEFVVSSSSEAVYGGVTYSDLRTDILSASNRGAMLMDERMGSMPIWIRGGLIGSGSFGKVYLAMDVRRGYLMAVKQVEWSSRSSARVRGTVDSFFALKREVGLLQNLRHENIVRYLYCSVDARHLNIFLEYVPGGSVVSLLRDFGAFQEPLAKHFVRQILRGLRYLHNQDIIHRDIKGANILVDDAGTVKISDFGTAVVVGQGIPVCRVLEGSVFWMAPEVVCQLPYGCKADIWSVGCSLIEMLTGGHPWADLTQVQALFKIGLWTSPSVPHRISDECDAFLRCALTLRQRDRPAAQDLLLHSWLIAA